MNNKSNSKRKSKYSRKKNGSRSSTTKCQPKTVRDVSPLPAVTPPSQHTVPPSQSSNSTSLSSTINDGDGIRVGSTPSALFDDPNRDISILVQSFRNKLGVEPLRLENLPEPVDQQINICVRKRPLSAREIANKDVDITTVLNSKTLVIHKPIENDYKSTCLEHLQYPFDYAFDEYCSNVTVYQNTARPLIRTMFAGGKASCVVFGRSGSGKTHTMAGIRNGKVHYSGNSMYAMAAFDILTKLERPAYKAHGVYLACNFYEVYGNKVYDLLYPNKPKRCVQEYKNGAEILYLTWKIVTDVRDVMQMVEFGCMQRTIAVSQLNERSSCSHAIFEFVLLLPNMSEASGKLSFIELAANEDFLETETSGRQTRFNEAEVHSSLFALKDCLRALSHKCKYVPCRKSKLTQVIRDSFVGDQPTQTCILFTLSPAFSSLETTCGLMKFIRRILYWNERDSGFHHTIPNYIKLSGEEMEGEEEEEEDDLF